MMRLLLRNCSCRRSASSGTSGNWPGVHQRQAEEVGEQAGQVRLGDQPEPGQHQIEALAGLPLRPQRPVHRQVVEHAAPRKKVSEPLDEVLIARVGAPARQRGILIDHRSCDGDSTRGKSMQNKL